MQGDAAACAYIILSGHVSILLRPKAAVANDLSSLLCVKKMGQGMRYNWNTLDFVQLILFDLANTLLISILELFFIIVHSVGEPALFKPDAIRAATVQCTSLLPMETITFSRADHLFVHREEKRRFDSSFVIMKSELFCMSV
jgi:hypothetical protein